MDRSTNQLGFLQRRWLRFLPTLISSLPYPSARFRHPLWKRASCDINRQPARMRAPAGLSETISCALTAAHGSVTVEIVAAAMDRCKWPLAELAATEIPAKPIFPWVAMALFGEITTRLLRRSYVSRRSNEYAVASSRCTISWAFHVEAAT